VFEYRYARRQVAETISTVLSPDDVARLLCEYVRPDAAESEVLAVALLNVKNAVIGVETVYHGNLAGTTVRVGEVFRSAVRLNAAAIVVAHNHPSGDPTPSADDLAVTAELVRAGRVLNIDLLDHVVLASRSHWLSLRALGVLAEAA
jgi:DNA repair protein RadC